MEVIQKETIKEVPANYWCDKYNYNQCGYGYNRYGGNYYGSPFASRGVAGAGLGLGIAGTALGLLALNRNGGFNLFGNNNNMPENVNINTVSTPNGFTAPTSFQVWEKEAQDVYNLLKELCDWALVQLNQRFQDRSTLNSELFGLYKNQVDADFGLYKSARDGFDVTNNRITNEVFSLYKETRDKDDEIRKELSDLKAQVAINAAVRPYQDKLIQCEIDKAFTAGVNYTDRKTCKAIYGQVTLPNTPVITGYAGANACGCPTVIEAGA